MKAKNLAILVVVMLVVGFAIIGVLVREDRKARAAAARDSGSNLVVETSTGVMPPGPLTPPISDASSPLADRKKRDELRRKILEAWAKGEKGPEVAAEAKQGRFEEHPNADGWGIEPKYIQSSFREQMFPMAQACYQDFLARKPDAGGRLVLSFKIVADENLGGVVEEWDDHDAGMVSEWTGDAKMETCVRESLMTVTFPPPAKGGVLTVIYPVVLEPGDDDDDGGK
ncbi:MAG: AgmX/PglI C-terminal domain-containing protein [Labilithrix sp.]